MYIVNILCQVSLPLFLTKVSLAIFCFRSMINGNCWFSSASLSLVGKKPLVPELRVMGGSCGATCKCSILCPISCNEISLFMDKTGNMW